MYGYALHALLHAPVYDCGLARGENHTGVIVTAQAEIRLSERIVAMAISLSLAWRGHVLCRHIMSLVLLSDKDSQHLVTLSS